MCWWRSQGTERMSKRLQLSTGWHGPALVIGTEGTTKVYLSYRGLPVLVSPEQCRMPSRDEVEMFEWMQFEADNTNLLEKFRKYNTQNGFIDERKKDREGLEPPTQKKARQEEPAEASGETPVGGAPQSSGGQPEREEAQSEETPKAPDPLHSPRSSPGGAGSGSQPVEAASRPVPEDDDPDLSAAVKAVPRRRRDKGQGPRKDHRRQRHYCTSRSTRRMTISEMICSP